VKLVEIPAGEFWMGSDAPEGGENERPRRLVKTAAYQIGETPVTNADFEKFVQSGYSERSFWSDEGWAWLQAGAIRSPRFWNDQAWSHYLSPEQPIVGVSWFEADAFARFSGLRLPSEVEWERAARGDDGRRFPWGDEWRPDFAAHRGGLRQTLPVGHFVQNVSPHGVRDCAGNVWEWCADEYASPAGDGRSPQDGGAGFAGDGRSARARSVGGASVALRSARGGSWNAHPPQLRCASRNAWPPGARYSNLGFRVACG
jgi:gamma-glutamyl hercynylcysteine S-oxide synthase